jgi:hypothetical protein
MRSLLAVLVVILVVIVLVAIVPRSEARVIPAEEVSSCAYAAYHPGFAVACFWEIYLATGGGYGDWGDGPSNSTTMMGGDADSVSGFKGDGDDVTGSPSDMDGLGGYKGDSDDVSG